MKDMMPIEDLTLHARFSPQEYALTYVVDENNYGESVQVPFGTSLSTPEIPAKVGHTFAGWYTAQAGGKLWNFAADKMPASDLTLYAQFTVNAYKVTYIDDTGQTIATSEVNFDELITMWRFDAFKMPAGDVTLYARYVTQSYKVTYVNDGGEKIFPRWIDFGEEVFEPREPQKAGHRFIGWYTEASDGRAWDFEQDMMPAADMTLHARYEKL